jgi:hypothetical protein
MFNKLTGGISAFAILQGKTNSQLIFTQGLEVVSLDSLLDNQMTLVPNVQV